jgi:hypothetical protein
MGNDFSRRRRSMTNIPDFAIILHGDDLGMLEITETAHVMTAE